MIQVGDTLPAGKLTVAAASGHKSTSVETLFADKKVVLFAVPGAFTPTCSNAHLPGFVQASGAFAAKGVDLIACVSVNDAFVMQAWGEAQNADPVMMLADGNGAYTQALGLDMQTKQFGGLRSQRYAMVIDKGVVSQLFVEAPQKFEVSSAEAVLAQL